MVNCKACGNEIAKGVKKCPNCGKDQRNFFMRHKIITGILVIVLLAGISGAIGEDNKPKSAGPKTSTNDTNTKEKEIEEKEIEEKVEFKVGEIISYKDFDLVFENQREISGLTNDTYLVFDVTIVSKKDNFNFFGDVQGVTNDNEVVDDSIAFVQEDLGDPIMTAWTKTLNKDQKAHGYLAFDKEISKIEIRSDLFSNDAIAVIVD